VKKRRCISNVSGNTDVAGGEVGRSVAEKGGGKRLRPGNSVWRAGQNNGKGKGGEFASGGGSHGKKGVPESSGSSRERSFHQQKLIIIKKEGESRALRAEWEYLPGGVSTFLKTEENSNRGGGRSLLPAKPRPKERDETQPYNKKAPLHREEKSVILDPLKRTSEDSVMQWETMATLSTWGRGKTFIGPEQGQRLY